jgi:hypothetical protein
MISEAFDLVDHGQEELDPLQVSDEVEDHKLFLARPETSTELLAKDGQGVGCPTEGHKSNARYVHTLVEGVDRANAADRVILQAFEDNLVFVPGVFLIFAFPRVEGGSALKHSFHSLGMLD